MLLFLTLCMPNYMVKQAPTRWTKSALRPVVQFPIDCLRHVVVKECQMGRLVLLMVRPRQRDRRQQVKRQLTVRFRIVNGLVALLRLQLLVVRLTVVEGPRLLSASDDVKQPTIRHSAQPSRTGIK